MAAKASTAKSSTSKPKSSAKPRSRKAKTAATLAPESPVVLEAQKLTHELTTLIEASQAAGGMIPDTQDKCVELATQIAKLHKKLGEDTPATIARWL